MDQGNRMTIAIASGKGGTGKTTVAINLALTLHAMGKTVCLLDCDVEAPNGHIFLDLQDAVSKTVTVPVPVVNEMLCDGCGRCGEVCGFSAIVSLGVKALAFPSLCHGCGGCMLACTKHAITEGTREVGSVHQGESYGLEFAYGQLRIGEAMSPPLIREVKKHVQKTDITIIDCPPGTSCPVVQSVRGTDYVVLVTEPTPFGLNDLRLAVEMLREIGLPFGVVINRDNPTNRLAHDYCDSNDIAIIGTIPDDRRAAEAYSRGLFLIDAVEGFKTVFEKIGDRILMETKTL